MEDKRADVLRRAVVAAMIWEGAVREEFWSRHFRIKVLDFWSKCAI
jgi:hypothetical protein